MNSRCTPSGEIVAMVMEYLTIPERRTAASVCRQWRNSVFNESFFKQICVKVSRPTDLSALSTSALYRRFRNVSIDYTHGNIDEVMLGNFLIGSPIERISINGESKPVKAWLENTLPFLRCLLYLKIETWMKKDDKDENLKKMKPASIGEIEEIGINHPGVKVLELKNFSACTITEINCPALIVFHTSTNRFGANCELLPIFEKYTNLQELSLNDEHMALTEELEFDMLVHLVKLQLDGRSFKVNRKFFNSISRMPRLHTLHLVNCMFCLPDEAQATYVVSSRITTFVVCSDMPAIIILNFPNLKKLTCLCNGSDLNRNIQLMCRFYSVLEEINIGVPSNLYNLHYCDPLMEFISEFRCLRSIQFTRMFTINITWPVSNILDIEKIRFLECGVEGEAALLIADKFPALRDLFLDNCSLMGETDIFEIDEKCSRGLRSYIPRCRISFRGSSVSE
ncbi:uncharacterized protein LOC129770449 [Toxorhynchites rutilus septentrionalis]|uniref:uncharacterized protein LOC129770449 n=1 Tax=Toxorhynchites rutilus septentrionalis TaxID=329112 RepID=UPI002478B2F7|nr:uncharacterized protein LOC129770449 [Toxorhynchites rutilus septentrionalis]